MKTINQYLDALLSLPADKKDDEVNSLIKNLQSLKLSGISGNDPVQCPGVIRKLQTALRCK